MRIGDQDVAVAIDRQPRGPTELVNRRGPAAKVFALQVVDLNSRGHIDDVDLVVAVDCDGAGLLESPRGQSAAAPHGYQFASAVVAMIAPGQRAYGEQ